MTPIAVADPPLRSSYGLHPPYTLRTVIELRSEDGITGIAEAHGGEKSTAEFERTREFVVGRSAYDLVRLSTQLRSFFEAAPGTSIDRSQTTFVPGENPHDVSLRMFSALEIAAIDLVARSHGLPFYDLLGGAVRDEIPFNAYLFYKHAGGGGEGIDARDDIYGEALTPNAIVRQAHALTQRYGFTGYKLKGGVLHPQAEVETILALRDAFPTAPLRIDPNAAWSSDTALHVAEQLHATLEYLEDPVPGLEQMGELAQAMRRADRTIPLASNVAVTHFGDIPAAFGLGAVQVILGDPHYWGGARAIAQLGRVCETFGFGLSMHSNSHLGISLMTMAHVAAATPQLTYACDTHYPWQASEDEIIEGGRVAIVNGAVRVPRLPGLGVAIDRDQLARAHERYNRIPYRKRDDADEMRKHVDQSWRRKVPAW